MHDLVIGDGAVRQEGLVFFPGTGAMLPDGPLRRLTNRTMSPKIMGDEADTPSAEGRSSLGHEYRLLFLDDPGVGTTPSHGPLTHDTRATDVGAIVDDATTPYGLSTDHSVPIGWSWGTVEAKPLAWLRPVEKPQRTLRTMVCIAASPGGSLTAPVHGVKAHQAHCRTPMVEALKAPTPPPDATGAKALQEHLNALILPFQGQTPYHGVDSGGNGHHWWRYRDPECAPRVDGCASVHRQGGVESEHAPHQPLVADRWD